MLEEKLKEFLKDKNKNLFLILSTASLFIYWVIGGILIYILLPGLNNVSSFLTYFVIGAILLFLLSLTCGFFIIVISILTGWDLLYPHGKRQFTLVVLFPLNVFLAKLIGIAKDRVRLSYIALSNALWTVQEKRLDGSRLLILLPHCLQDTKCPFKITYDIFNCKECGKCVIGDIVKLAKKYDIYVAVATGGTLARKIVVDFKPTFIIAVACERDLSLGIQEVYPIPVYGLLNSRPYGPCVNTTVDIKKLEDIIRLVKHLFTKKK